MLQDVARHHVASEYGKAECMDNNKNILGVKASPPPQLRTTNYQTTKKSLGISQHTYNNELVCEDPSL